jgi:hypothetical protein
MSRAFAKENDGWNYCAKEHESCMFMGEAGKCALATCIKEKEIKDKQKKSEAIAGLGYDPKQ